MIQEATEIEYQEAWHKSDTFNAYGDHPEAQEVFQEGWNAAFTYLQSQKDEEE